MIIITTEEVQTNRINLIDKAFELINLFNKANYEAFLVGGSVRDYIMNREIKDIDIATSALPLQIEEVASRNNLKYNEIGLKHGTITIIYDDIPMEVTTFRVDRNCDGRHADVEFVRSIGEDLSRRDFTINAIAFDRRKLPIDLYNGIRHIASGVIKAVGNPVERFKEDKLRALRAIRFATVLNFDIEHHTYEAIKKTCLDTISKERTRDELIKILESPNRYKGFMMLEDTGLLKQIIPEIEALKGVNQDTQFHPEKDVFIHTELALKSLPPNASLELVLATLLHDIGKPCSKSTENGMIHFYEHEIIGSEIAEKILYSLKLSSETTKKVVWLVANHMRVHKFSEMRKSKKIGLLTNEYFNDLTELLRADIMGSSGLNKRIEDLSEIEHIIEFMYDYKVELEERPILKEKVVNGYDVMNLGIKEGIEIGQILEKVNEATIEGNINTKEEAIEYIKKLVSTNNK